MASFRDDFVTKSTETFMATMMVLPSIEIGSLMSGLLKAGICRDAIEYRSKLSAVYWKLVFRKLSTMCLHTLLNGLVDISSCLACATCVMYVSGAWNILGKYGS